MATSLVNNKYRITRRIGGGSFGEIYMGYGPNNEKVRKHRLQTLACAITLTHVLICSYIHRLEALSLTYLLIYSIIHTFTISFAYHTLCYKQ